MLEKKVVLFLTLLDKSKLKNTVNFIIYLIFLLSYEL